MHVINLRYLKDERLHFMKLLNSGIKKSNKTFKRLNKDIFILENNNKYPLNLLDLEANKAKKKEENALKRQKRKMKLIQATSFTGVNNSLLCSIDDDAFLSTIINGGLLFLLASGGHLFAIASGGLLSAVADNGFFSIIAIGSLLFVVVGDVFLSVIVGGSFLSITADNDLLSFVPNSASLSNILLLLFQPGTFFCAPHYFLASCLLYLPVLQFHI